MTRAIPNVQRYMTRCLYAIEPDQPLVDAHKAMREHGFKHLPVFQDNQLVGIISMHDLHLIETLRDVDPADVPVADAMSRKTFSVRPETSIDVVAQQMAEKGISSVLVTDGEDVKGLFTTTDALHAISDLARMLRG